VISILPTARLVLEIRPVFQEFVSRRCTTRPVGFLFRAVGSSAQTKAIEKKVAGKIKGRTSAEYPRNGGVSRSMDSDSRRPDAALLKPRREAD